MVNIHYHFTATDWITPWFSQSQSKALK